MSQDLEPEVAAHLTVHAGDNERSLRSIAISMRRIADALDSETGPHSSIREGISAIAMNTQGR